MSRNRRVETPVERAHGHCADVLMRDFGIPQEMRVEVCEEIAKVWVQITLVHFMIIWSVRGYQPCDETKPLEIYLSEHATHEQKNRKGGPRVEADDF